MAVGNEVAVGCGRGVWVGAGGRGAGGCGIEVQALVGRLGGVTEPVTIGVTGRRVGVGDAVVVGKGVAEGVTGVPVRVGDGVTDDVGVWVGVGWSNTMDAVAKKPGLPEAMTMCVPGMAQAVGTTTVVWNVPLARIGTGSPRRCAPSNMSQARVTGESPGVQ